MTDNIVSRHGKDLSPNDDDYRVIMATTRDTVLK